MSDPVLETIKDIVIETSSERATRIGSMTVLSEPLTYDRQAPASYLRDLALSQRNDDIAAHRRLERHREEMRVELPKLERRSRQATAEHGVEYRVSPNSITSTLAPPLWVVQDFATAPRAKRVLADQVQGFPLPRGAHSVNLPRLTTGETEQPVQDLGATSSTDIVDASSQSIVTTIAGRADAALQLLEQSPPGAHLDFVLFKDMVEAYDAQLELQLLNGTGTGENLLGILNASLPSGNKVSYTGAATGQAMFPFIGQVVAQVGNQRKAPPEAFLMTTSRWAWLSTQEDQQNRPLLLADWGQQGQGLLTFPTFLNDAMPVTLGAGGNQDAIIACRPSDIMLWESPQATTVGFEVLSGTLQARFQLHGSVASIIRYPAGQATLTGTGMAIASGY